MTTPTDSDFPPNLTTPTGPATFKAAVVVGPDHTPLPVPDAWSALVLRQHGGARLLWFGLANYGPTAALADKTLPAIDPDRRATVDAFTALGVTVTTERTWLRPPSVTLSGLTRIVIPDGRASVQDWLTHLGVSWRMTSDGLTGDYNGEEFVFDGDRLRRYDTDYHGQRILTAATFQHLRAEAPSKADLVQAIRHHFDT